MAVVPLKVYFHGGLVKVEIGLAKGKKLYDKRDDIAKKDQKREAEREFKVRNFSQRERKMLEEEYPLKLNKFELFRHKTLEERAAEFDGKLLQMANTIGENLLEERFGNGRLYQEDILS